MTVHVVFINDWVLLACKTEERAKQEIDRLKAKELVDATSHYGANNKAEIESHMKRCYFHSHSVPEAE